MGLTMTAPRLPERNAETYLGDGLYASFDGFCVWLWQENKARQKTEITNEWRIRKLIPCFRLLP